MFLKKIPNGARPDADRGVIMDVYLPEPLGPVVIGRHVFWVRFTDESNSYIKAIRAVLWCVTCATDAPVACSETFENSAMQYPSIQDWEQACAAHIGSVDN